MKRPCLFAAVSLLAFACGCAHAQFNSPTVDQASLNGVDRVAVVSLLVSTQAAASGSLLTLAQVGTWGAQLAPSLERRVEPLLDELLEPRFEIVAREKVKSSAAYQALPERDGWTPMGGLRRVDLFGGDPALREVAQELGVDALILASYGPGVRKQSNGQTVGQCFARFAVVDAQGEVIFFQREATSANRSMSVSNRVKEVTGRVDYESMSGPIKAACMQATEAFLDKFAQAVPLE